MKNDFSTLSLPELQQLQNQINLQIQTKQPNSQKIVVKTDPDHTHEGYLRKDGRSVIYERRVEVEVRLARSNYTIPHEQKKGKKALKSDAFFNDPAYGEAISKAWNYVYKNRNARKSDNQKVIDEFFARWI